MSFLFFSKTDKNRKQGFFKPMGRTASADDTSTSSERDSTAGGMIRTTGGINQHAYRKLRLLRSTSSLDDLLERLLRNAESADGLSSSNYLEQMLQFIQKNPELVNRTPKGFHSNPLELAITLGDLKVAQELLQLKAQVRPENRHLNKKIEHLLQSNPSKEKRLQSTPSFRR